MTSRVKGETSGAGEPDEARLSLADRRFRRQFNLALLQLEQKGTITRAERHRYRVASYNQLTIKDGKAFVQALRADCEQLAGDLLDDIVSWWEWLVDWLIENWATVLKVVLSLLVFLETA